MSRTTITPPQSAGDVPIIFSISRINNVMHQVTFDPVKGSGTIATNASFISESDRDEVLGIFKDAIRTGIAVGSYIKVIGSKSSFGGVTTTVGECAILTPCSITIDGVLLKAGVPVRPILGGIVQIKKGVPVRFTEIVTYQGSTIDPIDVLMSQDIASVMDAVTTGTGSILANLRVVPIYARTRVENVLENLRSAGFDGVLFVGEPNTDVLGIPIERDHIGIVAIGGTNPPAIVQGQGIPIRTYPLSELVDIGEMDRVV